MTKKLLCYFGLFFFALVYSCGLSGPKPDKHIVATLEVVGDNMSEEELKAVILSIENRFDRWGAYPEIEEGAVKQTLDFNFKTHASQERVLKLLTARADLEFYEVIKQEFMMPFIQAADRMAGGEGLSEIDDLLGNEDSEENEKAESPLSSKFQSGFTQGGLFAVLPSDTAEVRGYLMRRDVNDLLGSEKETIKFLWGAKANDNGGFVLYAIRTLPLGKPRMNGRYIEGAEQNFSVVGAPVVTMLMNGKGSVIWEQITSDAFQNNFQIAIVIDDKVYSAPGVIGPIAGGKSEISGDFTEEEAADLASMIRAGALPEIKILSFDVVPIK